MKRTYKSTRLACYAGYLVQAIVNNLSPVFFIIYLNDFGITYSLLSCLIIVNFAAQLVTDVLCIRLIGVFGQRKCVTAAHALSAAGLIMLGILPGVLTAPYLGLLISTVICAIGSGMIEVLISPIVSALPSDKKTGDMSLLHSFYCWGQLAVVLLSTIALAMGVSWRVIAVVWAAVPVFNAFNFRTVPIVENKEEEHVKLGGGLFKSGMFICFAALMLCAGAGELSMSQWSSLFVEKSLGIPKAVGDVLGPCSFALFMGTGRVVLGIYGDKLKINRVLFICAAACLVSYIAAAVSTAPLMSLAACALCGFSVSVMWPGILSSAAHTHFNGSTAMFAVLALFGDLGCASGPALTGFLSDAAPFGFDGLRFGLFAAVIFPIIMMIIISVISAKEKVRE